MTKWIKLTSESVVHDDTEEGESCSEDVSKEGLSRCANENFVDRELYSGGEQSFPLAS